MFQKDENESSCELLTNLTRECFFRPKTDAIFGIVQGPANISGVKPSKQKARRGEAVGRGYAQARLRGCRLEDGAEGTQQH